MDQRNIAPEQRVRNCPDERSGEIDVKHCGVERRVSHEIESEVETLRRAYYS